VLREAFDQPYRQISKLLAISEANDRRLAARAALPSRRRTEAGRSAPPSTSDSRFVDVQSSHHVRRAARRRCRHERQWHGCGIALRRRAPDRRREWHDRSCIYSAEDRAIPPATQRSAPTAAERATAGVGGGHGGADRVHARRAECWTAAGRPGARSPRAAGAPGADLRAHSRRPDHRRSELAMGVRREPANRNCGDRRRRARTRRSSRSPPG
jgi:hypothetical protein